MNDPTLAFIFLFWHAALKEIRNVDTLISAVHTFLTSLNLFTQPFLQEEADRERVKALLQKQKLQKSDREGERTKRGFGAKEQREKGIWELGKDRKRGIGDRGKGTRDRGLSHIK